SWCRFSQTIQMDNSSSRVPRRTARHRTRSRSWYAACVSETTASTRRLGRGEGREALIDAALEILVEGGLKTVTYRSVAMRAGVTHGLVRYHFRSLDV